MNRSWLRALGILACCALFGCGSSPPTRFYILNEIAPAATPVASAANPIALRVEPVAIAPELDRPELVTRSGPNRVHVAGSERWAAPLPDQIRRVISDDLSTRLPPGLVADPNESSTTEPRRLLRIAIAEFYADDSCAVTLRASWSLDDQHGQRSHGTEQLHVPSSALCTGEIPAAMSRALAILDDRIAAAATASS
jgi:uncharacterized lipoprotein YmbA